MKMRSPLRCSLLMLLACGVEAAECHTKTCWDYGRASPLVSWLEVEWDANDDYYGPSSSPYVSGDIIWVAAWTHLVAYDGSDPRNVRLIHAESIPRLADRVVVEDNIAYVTGFYGLTIVDISDPQQPLILAATGPMEIYRALYHDGMLYTAGYNGIVVFDVRNPSAPYAKASYNRRGSAIVIHGDEIICYDRGTLYCLKMTLYDTLALEWQLQVGGREVAGHGDLIFVAGEDQLRTYRLESTGPPAQVGSRHLDSSGMVAVVGGRLYAQDMTGIRVYDLSSVPEFAEVGFIGGYTWRMSPNQLGDLVVMSTGNGMLLIADPNVLADQPESGLLPIARQFQGVAARGDVVFGSYANAYPDPRGIVAFDVSNPRAPRVIGEIMDLPRYPYDMQFRDHYLFTNSLVCLDVSDPANMRLVNTTRIGNQFAIQDSVAFVCGLPGGDGYTYSITSVDIGDPSQPRVISSLPIGIRTDLIANLEPAGGHLVVGADDYLALVDTNDPAAMRLKWTMPMRNGHCRDLAVHRDLVFYVGDQSVLAIVDISDRLNPRLRSLFYPPINGGYQSIVIGNDVAYLSSPIHGVLVIDFSDVDRPRLTGAIEPLFFASDYSLSLAATSDQVIIISSEGFLQASPRQCGDVRPVQAVTIDVRPGNDCNRVPCGDHTRGQVVVALLTTKEFDATTVDPTTLRFGPGGAREIHVVPAAGPDAGPAAGSRNERRGAGDDGEGRGRSRRHLRDVDCDGDMDFIAHFNAEDAAFACGDTVAVLTGAALNGTMICASGAITTDRHCGGHGARIGEPDDSANSTRDEQDCDADKGADDALKDPASLFERSPVLSPNPFNPATDIAFNLARGTHLSVAIHDLAGRRVCRLAESEFAAGAHVVRWGGCDDHGRQLPSGIYFVRIAGDGDSVVLRAALLR